MSNKPMQKNKVLKKRNKKKFNVSQILFSILVLVGISSLCLLYFQPQLAEALIKEIEHIVVSTSTANDNTIPRQGQHNPAKEEELVKEVEEIEEAVNKPPVNFSEFKTYSFKYKFNVDVKGYLSRVEYKIYVPREDYQKQYIAITSISMKPEKLENEDETVVAKYTWNNVQDKQYYIEMQGQAKIRTYDLKTAKKLNFNISPEKDLSRYLQSEELIESDDPYIIGIANGIEGNSKEEILQNIYVFLQNNIKYEIVPNLGAKRTLMERRGKCSDYTAAMVALCRAKNIPARVVSGDMLEDQDTAHAWVEVYYDEYGWVTYDPTFQGTFIKKANGQEERRLDSTEVNIDYIQTARNLLSKHPIMMYYYKNNSGTANIGDSLEFQKL